MKNRVLPAEIAKADKIRQENGFYEKYMSGKGLDIGYRGYNFPDATPVLPNATGIELDFPGYDGKILPFEEFSQDFVFASHSLEHMEDHVTAIREWYRVIKIGGFLIICVPHQHLYERKKKMPSIQPDHKRFYLPSILMGEIEEALEVNSYRLELLRDCDENYDYEREPHIMDSNFLWRDRFEIECVLRKIQKPKWNLME